MTSRLRARTRYARALLVRSLTLALLWWALTEGEAIGAFGLIVVALALAATFALAAPRPGVLRLSGLLRFLAVFFWESLRGGVDVAGRALALRPAIAPGIVEIPLLIPDEREQVLVAGVLSLVPGTVSAELEAERLRLHVLDHRLPVEETVRGIEARVAAVFGHLPAAKAKRRRREGD